MKLTALLANLLYAFAAPSTAQDTYFEPNSTGIRLQNGFERVYIQVLALPSPAPRHA